MLSNRALPVAVVWQVHRCGSGMLSNCALPVALAWQVWSWVVVKLRCAGRSCIFGMRHTAYIHPHTHTHSRTSAYNQTHTSPRHTDPYAFYLSRLSLPHAHSSGALPVAFACCAALAACQGVGCAPWRRLASAGHRRSAGSVCVLCAALAACQGVGCTPWRRLASAGHRCSAGSICVLCAALAACQGVGCTPGVGWAPALCR